jgi:hypothetical protein
MMFASRLDALLPSPYLSPAMNRFLLTVLALLTGLAAQVSPAQAALRGGSGAEVGAVEAVRGGARLVVRVAIVAKARGEGFAQRFGQAAILPDFGIAAPGIRIGIDRARE